MGNFFEDLWDDPVPTLLGGVTGGLLGGGGGQGGIGSSIGSLLGGAVGNIWSRDHRQPAQSGGTAAPAGSGSGGSGSGASGNDVSTDSIEQFLQNNPALAKQAYELTAQYMPQYAALARAEATKDRGADLTDVQSLLPMVRGIYESGMRPEEKAMRDLLFSQVSGELSSGEKLTPEQARDTEQYLRTAENSRGILAGSGSASRESVAKAIEGMNLLNQRQEKAKSLLTMEAATKPDPYAAILGRPSSSTNLAAQQSAAGTASTSPSFYSTNAWNAASNKLAAANYDRAGEWRDQMINMMKLNPDLAGLSL